MTKFADFCNDFGIDFIPDLEEEKFKNKTKKVQERKGEELQIGDHKYIIVKSEDCYREIPTILNSEEAALVVAEKLFN